MLVNTLTPSSPPARPGPGSSQGENDQGLDPVELRILLIEDSVLLQKRLTDMLTLAGVMRVTGTAATEPEARERIDTGEYDVLVVDVELGKGSGIGAIGHARQRYSDRQPLIIVLTNFPLPAVRSLCLAAGADHFLDKMRQFQEVRPLIAALKRPPR